MDRGQTMLLPMMIGSIGMLIVSTLLCRQAWADEPTESKRSNHE